MHMAAIQFKFYSLCARGMACVTQYNTVDQENFGVKNYVKPFATKLKCTNLLYCEYT